MAEGANIEILQLSDDPWEQHMVLKPMRSISAWRTWVEISTATGRTGELADALFKQLLAKW